MEPHGDGAFVVAEERCGKRLPKTKVAKEEAQVESLLGALRQSVVFSLLSAEAHRGAELDFPTAGGAILHK